MNFLSMRLVVLGLFVFFGVISISMAQESYAFSYEGERVFTLSDGSKHLIEFEDNNSSCQIELTLLDGSKHAIEFGDNNSSCQRELILPDDSVYFGELKYGKPDGKGARIWLDGSVYFGEFKDGNHNGQGTEIYAGKFGYDETSGEEVMLFSPHKYVGGFKGGMAHGKGIITWADGGEYDGEWEYGMLNGEGRRTSADGCSVEDGIWRDGKFVSEYQ